MATLSEIRNRIVQVKKTQKIVKAMKMVAAAKLARAQSAIKSARPYAVKLGEVMASVTSGVETDAHPMLKVRDVNKLDLVLFSSDRGLCGAFNANMIKRCQAIIDERGDSLESYSILAVGRRGAEHFTRHGGRVVKTWSDFSAVTPALAVEIAGFLMQRYEDGEADETVVIFPEFVSALTQNPTAEVLLPVRPPTLEEGEAKGAAYEIEPSAEALLTQLVPRSVEFAVFRALLENSAGEHGARMTSMDSATNNTEELTRSLTLVFNKARQAAITAELVEIVSGAEAL